MLPRIAGQPMQAGEKTHTGIWVVKKLNRQAVTLPEDKIGARQVLGNVVTGRREGIARIGVVLFGHARGTRLFLEHQDRALQMLMEEFGLHLDQPGPEQAQHLQQIGRHCQDRVRRLAGRPSLVLQSRHQWQLRGGLFTGSGRARGQDRAVIFIRIDRGTQRGFRPGRGRRQGLPENGAIIVVI
jgi:hypothetical protein